MSIIEIKNLNITLGEFCLKDINLKIERGERFFILGPTGSGKTVLIETIAGLHRPKSGQIIINGTDMTRFLPEERNIAYIPQDYALFMNMTVEENIAFGLRIRKVEKDAIRKKVDSLAKFLGIESILYRHPIHLSGGEKQRTALARALAIDPEILFLDEPMAALDEKTKNLLGEELARIHNETGATFVYITHNFEEAIDAADKIAIISKGEIIQTGTVDDIFINTKSEYVKDFICTEQYLRKIQKNCSKLSANNGDNPVK